MNKKNLCGELQVESVDKVGSNGVKLNFPVNDNCDYLSRKYLVRLKRFPEQSPEKQLWKMVICQAIEDATTKSNRGKKAKRLALSWFTEESDDFKTVCELAGYKHEIVKKNALRIIANETNRLKE